jgi:hypothetical protein
LVAVLVILQKILEKHNCGGHKNGFRLYMHARLGVENQKEQKYKGRERERRKKI